MNNFSVEGNLTRDPELRFTPTGKQVVGFSVAENRRWTDAQGQQQEETSFFDCEAWGTLADNIAASFSKGQRVLVIGRLKQDSWETPEGDKRSKVKVVASSAGHSLQFGLSTYTDSKPRSLATVGGGAPLEADTDPF